MNVHELMKPPPAWLSQALAEFEAQFRYPLGPGRSFRISHGRDYVTFFQAMGEARVFVAERGGIVLGTLAAIVRTLRFPDGETRRVAYLCDLKVTPQARGGRALFLLLNALQDRLKAPCQGYAYAVVMNGTPRTPGEYSGQLGLPAFEKLDEFAILRIPTSGASSGDHGIQASQNAVEATYGRLTQGQYTPLSGDSAVRSQMPPVYLESTDACGVLEDTRLGKRLIDDAENEMVSAHLSRFAYAEVTAGARLLNRALARAKDAGFPALFTALPASGAARLAEYLPPQTVLTSASVYACGFTGKAAWRIDTAEI